MSVLSLCALAGVLAAAVRGQQVGTVSPEVHPPFSAQQCTKSGGCKDVPGELVLDAQWRWLHEKGGYTNCLSDAGWNATSCPDAATCATHCELEGLDVKDYSEKVGVDLIPGGVKLSYISPKGAKSSRLYLLEGKDQYRMFKLKNREFSVTVDASTLSCGLNGALYFVEMPQNGGKDGTLNGAGAAYGTGYCDAQCPRDMKFIPKIGANLKDWKKIDVMTPELEPTKFGPVGHYGACCAEMDIYEANREAGAYTAHPCDIDGLQACEGEEGCGSKDRPGLGPCDKDGCGFNPYRVGERGFFGTGDGFTVDTSKPVTLVTQFVTSDHTDTGDLVEIRRVWIQDGKVIKNAKTTNIPGSYDSLTAEYCDKSVETYINTTSYPFKELGGLKAMGKALERGMVLTLSVWDDSIGRMLWLDGEKSKIDQNENQPGITNGPCSFKSGTPGSLAQTGKDAFVAFTDVKFGEIGSTYAGGVLAGAALVADEAHKVPSYLQVLRKAIHVDSASDHNTVHFIQKQAEAITRTEL